MANDSIIPTSELLKMIFKTKTLNKVFSTNEKNFSLPSFSEYINKLCNDSGKVAEHIIVRANIERTYGHKIFAGTRNPSRDVVIQLAFGFGLDVDETQELLKVARKSQLYPRVKRDIVIIYCLHNNYSIEQTQMYLNDLNLPILGSGNKNE